MAENMTKIKIWLIIVGSAVVLTAFIGFRVYYLRSHGQQVFWLAELFSPVALFCVLAVTFVDKLVRKADKPKSRRVKKAA